MDNIPDWNFLKVKNIYTGEDCNQSWWTAWEGRPWEKVWKEFLVKLHDEWIKLPTERPLFNYKSTEADLPLFETAEKFLYTFLLEKNLVDSDIVEWSDNLNKLSDLSVTDVFIRKSLGKGEEPNPRIPSSLFYIELIHSDLIDSLLTEDEFHKMWFKRKSVQEKFSIHDTKSKYGQLRVDLSGYSDGIYDLVFELEHKSEFTCERCGKQPLNSKGEHIIWQSTGHWIENYCKDCARKDCYDERSYDYKDFLIIGKPYKQERISDMMKNRWSKQCDHNKITIQSYSMGKTTYKSWNPWN